MRRNDWIVIGGFVVGIVVLALVVRALTPEEPPWRQGLLPINCKIETEREYNPAYKRFETKKYTACDWITPTPEGR